MLRLSANKISLAASALLCAGFAQAQTLEPVSPLTPSATSVAISYQKPSTPGGSVSVTLTATASTAFVVSSATVPFWLTLGAMSGTAAPSPGGASISFVANNGAASLAAGSYTAPIHFAVSGFQDLVVTVTLTVNDPPSTLTVSPSSLTVNWVYGSAQPTTTLTMSSSDQPIAFTVSAAVTSPTAPAGWIHLSIPSGIAYTFGTPVTISFLADVLNNSTVGSSLTGTITVTPAGGSPTTVALTINVTEPPAVITSIFPAQTPLHASGSLTVVLTGSGFGTSGGYSAKPTKVSISYGATPLTDVTTIGGSISTPTPNTLLVTIPFQDNATTPNAILSAPGTVGISVTNTLAGETATTSSLTVTTNPIIYSITDGASLLEPSAGAVPSFAPYEIVSIFGDNFGPTAGTPVQGTLDSFSRYPNSLTANGHALTVSFYKQGTVGAGTHIADAYLLFATNNQINAIVPSGVLSGTTITQLQIVVTYNSNASSVYAATPVAAKPGIFTTAASGQGQGAILLSNFSVNSSTNKAVKGTSTVLIYLTGLGTPTSASANTASTAAAKFPASCLSPAAYMGTINAENPPPSPVWATDDGAVILSSKIANGHFPPCFATSPTVTIGGVAATVSYAGWVADSIAGLYQINASVPKTAPSGAAVPVVVTMGGVSSQPGVTMQIQ